MQKPILAGLCFVVMAMFYLLYEGNKHSSYFTKRTASAFKGGATCCAAVVALNGAITGGSTEGYLLALGLLICAVADVVLNYRFIAGMGVFALGHMCYCTAYIIAVPPATLNLALMLMLVSVVFFGALKFKTRLGARAVPFVLYALVLCAMLSLSVTQKPMLAIGAIFFIISDITLARNLLWGATRRQSYISLGCYYLGQYLIAASVL